MTADWFAALVETPCGSCGERQPKGTPMRRLRSTGVRCPACAEQLLGERVPEHLQPATSPDDPAPTFQGQRS